MSGEQEQTEEADEQRESDEEVDEEVLSIEDLLLKILGDINGQIKKLDDETKELTAASDEIRNMVYKKLEKGQLPPELEEPEEFRNALDKLHRSLGKTIDYVLRVEKSRKYIEKQVPYDELLAQFKPSESEGRPGEAKPPPVNVTVTPPPNTPSVTQPQRPGFWWARSEIKKAQIYAELERAKLKERTVVTTKTVTDIVEFGRQLMPAFNKIKKWIPGALALVRQFQNESLYFVLHEECATYLSQTLGALESWVGACVEYRKNLLEGRKLGMARAIAKIAEAQSYAPTIQAGGAFSKEGFKMGKKGFEEKTR